MNNDINDAVVKSAIMALEAYGDAEWPNGVPLTPEEKADIIRANEKSWARRVQNTNQETQ